MSIAIDIELPTLKELKVAFRMLPSNIAAKHMTAALGRAIDPAYKRLKKNTPKGPTGNLRKAIGKKTRKYVRSGAGVALVGFRKPPKGDAMGPRRANELGYHAHLLEKPVGWRTTEGRFASSFKTRGPFEIKKFSSRLKASRVRTSPRPPQAFFKSASKGLSVSVGKMPLGGKKGKPPLATTFSESKSELETEMRLQMSASVEKAIMEMAGKFRLTGSR